MRISGFGEKRISVLAENGITNCRELLSYFPVKYIDFSNVSKLDTKSKNVQCLYVRAIGEPQCLFLKRFSSVKVLMEDCESKTNFLAVWYNQPYIKKRIVNGTEYLLYGKMSPTKFGEFVVQSIKPYSEEMKKPLAVYKPMGNIKSANFKTAIADALSKTNIESVIPVAVQEKFDLVPLNSAYSFLHFPTNLLDIKKYKQRIELENYLKLLTIKDYLKKKRKKDVEYLDYVPLLEEFKKVLDFELTQSQENAIKEICFDLTGDYLTNRLLEGDVGSGKTIVAFFIMFVVCRSGFQSVMLAPTEILASQHYKRAKILFDKLNISVCYLSAKCNNQTRKSVINNIKNGDNLIIIGTHSVLSDDVEFANLGLVVTDEQHRFGVGQRAKLSKKNDGVDTVVMSATPIPRSLSLVLYGDLNITTLDQGPFVTTSRKTFLVTKTKEKDMWKYIQTQLENGVKVFVVCPTIYDENMQNDISNIENIEKKLQKNEYFANNLGVLHGKLKREEQEKVIENFETGKKNMLLSTTIIEVGIDIVGADILVVLSPERFGLATLHQLRGRIGRSGNDASCFCVASDEIGQVAQDRLNYFSKHNNGFEIAEYDCKTRGSGDLFGVKQHGRSEMTNSFGFDLELFEKAKKVYTEIFESHIETTLIEIAIESYGDILEKIILN